jgi:TRAP-type C4-dicarboxylate transport system substrate-binding protein
VGGRNFVTKKPIKTPEDLKGLRIRTPGAPVWQESIRALGATPVALPWIETYPALQQGVIDGAEAQHPATFGSKLFEVAKHISLTNHILLMNGPVVGTKWFRQLPENFRAIVIEEAVKAGDLTTQMVLDSEKEFEKEMARGGATIHVVNVKPFRERAENAYVQLGLVDLKKEVLKTLGK